MSLFRPFSAVCIAVLSVTSSFAADGLKLLPESIQFSGAEWQQQLLVQSVRDGNLGMQITDGLEYQVDNANVVRVEDGVAIPVGDGEATITVRQGERTATASVQVTNFDAAHRWLFRNHVESVLSKAGCNSGACHGAAAGKNGFYLSLRGYDPDFDFWSITRQARGRRIIPSDPGRSLLLTKPTGAIPHKGGIRFDEDSLDYRVIAEWIASGQPEPTDEDPRLERLEILPEKLVVREQGPQQFMVRAHFSDGHIEDVTQWAKYSSTNSSVLDVDQTGAARITGNGEGSVVAWYLGNNVVATVTSPYPNDLPEFVFTAEPQENVIDKLVLEKLQQLNLPPSPVSSDGEFLRRVFLDTIGLLPTEAETRAFLADASMDKRSRVIDQLLERPEFVDYWTYRWSDLLLLSGKRLRPKALEAFSDWIREQVNNNVPWDKFAEKIVLAKGNSYENGAVNFYSLHQDPLESAETVSMAFLGMSINCARCHDHPLEKWTNNDYYGMANLFARVRAKGWGGDFRGGDGDRDVFVVESGELIQPRLGEPQAPRPLDGETIPFDAVEDRRGHLANWLTSKENPYFTKAIVNRVWANFLGIGLVEPVDDLRLTNPPSNTPLLLALEAELQKHDYDLKAIMRLIMNSRTYQRTSAPVAGNEQDDRFYSRVYPRRLKAEILLDTVSQVLESPTVFPNLPEGTRALQLKDSDTASYFLDVFGRPERLNTCECERSDAPSMVQVLHLTNGDTVNSKLANPKNVIGKWIEANATFETVVDRSYLRALSRFPTQEERTQILSQLAQSPPAERRQAIEDLLWSILNTREFLFQH